MPSRFKAYTNGAFVCFLHKMPKVQLRACWEILQTDFSSADRRYAPRSSTIYGSGERIKNEFSGLNEFLVLKPGSKPRSSREANPWKAGSTSP